MTLLQIAEKFPPNICRFLARKMHGTKPMSHSDLAEKTGLSRAGVALLSKRKSWRGVPIERVVGFSEACGVSLTNPKRTTEFMRRASKKYLVGANKTQRKFLSEILKAQPA